MRKKGLVGFRIIEVGEHEVLPDENPQFVTNPEKIRRLIGHGAADADHVHASLRGQRQPGAIVVTASREVDDIGSGPDGTATEYTFAVDDEGEILAIHPAIDRDVTETGATKAMDDTVNDDRHRIQKRRTMRMRPPLLNILDLKDCNIEAAAICFKGLLEFPASQHDVTDVVLGDQG